MGSKSQRGFNANSIIPPFQHSIADRPAAAAATAGGSGGLQGALHSPLVSRLRHPAERSDRRL